MSIWKKYGFGWLMLVLFLGSLLGHWLFGWADFVEDQKSHGEAAQFAPFVNEMLRETFENWQSEFLQLLFQVAGLTYLLFVGSPQSKEEDDRLEEKLDLILKRVDPDNAEDLIKKLDARFPGRYAGPEL